ncbi:hypothetical protein C0J50_18878 [Silurus asotus]|uniref:Uncharacterized protein n=1 Tax=Silurus asotus TaxID=30991 RepID=A0AAD5ARH5_SILAS|nr:hypothetical protein C0J50_18878 [Silurus asotus]
MKAVQNRDAYGAGVLAGIPGQWNGLRSHQQQSEPQSDPQAAQTLREELRNILRLSGVAKDECSSPPLSKNPVCAVLHSQISFRIIYTDVQLKGPKLLMEN